MENIQIFSKNKEKFLYHRKTLEEVKTLTNLKGLYYNFLV